MEGLHPSAIELGLARVGEVARRLAIAPTPGVQVVTFAGTNGKGSSVTALAAILRQRGRRVGVYTSPHIRRYNERITLNDFAVDDDRLCAAFDAIDKARGDVSLTYFEFGTLAALWLMQREELDYWLLEVGLGGRLDAVNIIDPTLAVITSIDMDHEDWLGDTREKIAEEKLGILRPGVACVCSEPNPTDNMAEIFDRQRVAPVSIGREFRVRASDRAWHVDVAAGEGEHRQFVLPTIHLPPNSVAAALQASSLLRELPDAQQAEKVFTSLRLAGRFEIRRAQGLEFILDVAHNPAATTLLADTLRRYSNAASPKFVAVLGMMADKKIAATLAPLVPLIDRWWVAPFTDVPRSASADTLARALQSHGVEPDRVSCCESIASAVNEAAALAGEQRIPPMILVVGSFVTVGLAQEYLASQGFDE